MLTVPNPLRSFALARPDHPALISGARRWSAQALSERVALRARELTELGVGPGDLVALLGSAGAGWVIDFFALGWLGAQVAPLPARAPGAELDRLLDLLPAPVALIAEDRAAAQAIRSPLRRIAPAFAAQGEGPPAAERDWPLEETRALIFTSGSSGEPRPIALSTAQLIFGAVGSAVRLGHQADNRWLCCLPLHHVGGLSILLRAALFNTTVVLAERFDAGEVAEALDSGGISLASLVPAMLAEVLDRRPAERRFPPSLRAILVGGDRTPEALLERCRAIAAPLALTYGMTEAASQIATRHPGDLDPDAGAGPPLCFTRIETDPEGTLVVRGPTVRDGRLRSADRGAIDARGRLHPAGRRDAVIISGGEKVSPEEIEAALCLHPAIADALVFGLPDPRWGQRPHALLVARPGAELPGPEPLAQFLREQLSSFKVPLRSEWIAQLPLGATGKPSRRLAAEALERRQSVSGTRSST